MGGTNIGTDGTTVKSVLDSWATMAAASVATGKGDGGEQKEREISSDLVAGRRPASATGRGHRRGQRPLIEADLWREIGAIVDGERRRPRAIREGVLCLAAVVHSEDRMPTGIHERRSA
ncbi:hypothetical protein BHE74_00021919 [Ensete ventricosum]|nr:hypothetical protein GW17_00053162 [Ensete ventricosum]RWW70406.1 hypothetical protein BHE74_00021919 [Ensete ventricosum]RZR92544.1 hypothetical protein BHM03_00020857 [Ensete ventricosum]